MNQLPAILLAAATALALAPMTRAQAASYGFFGNACATTPVPLTVTGLPQLGGSFTVRTTSPVISQFGARTAVLLSGASSTQWLGLPLPLPLAGLSTPDLQYCGDLLVSPDVLLPVPFGGGSTTSKITFQVPNRPALLGLNVYQQAVELYADRNTGVDYVSTSRGGVAVLGR